MGAVDSYMKNFDNCQTLYTVGQAVGVDMPRERSQSNRKESAEILEDIAEEEDLIIIGSDPQREERNDESSSETLKSVIPGMLHMNKCTAFNKRKYLRYVVFKKYKNT